jgi:hypothetical protein
LGGGEVGGRVGARAATEAISAYLRRRVHYSLLSS